MPLEKDIKKYKTIISTISFISINYSRSFFGPHANQQKREKVTRYKNRI